MPHPFPGWRPRNSCNFPAAISRSQVEYFTSLDFGSQLRFSRHERQLGQAATSVCSTQFRTQSKRSTSSEPQYVVPPPPSLRRSFAPAVRKCRAAVLCRGHTIAGYGRRHQQGAARWIAAVCATPTGAARQVPVWTRQRLATAVRNPVRSGRGLHSFGLKINSPSSSASSYSPAARLDRQNARKARVCEVVTGTSQPANQCSRFS